MGDVFDEDGEILDFHGTEETRIRGTLATDGMGRWNINAKTLLSLMPDDIDYTEHTDNGEEGEELVFWIDVTVWKPTREFREE